MARTKRSRRRGHGEDDKRERARGKRRLLASGPSQWPLLLLALAAVEVVRYRTQLPLLYQTLETRLPETRLVQRRIYVPPSLTAGQRRLSIDLGNGDCQWTPPSYEVPDAIDFHKTVIAGFPSGDKRMIFVQMEALTGWPAKDEWDFEYLGISNHPFVKANYPHHEGIWGWGNVADQVVMMIRNIRRSMVEYHDILWDIGYAKTWEDASLHLENLYSEAPPIEDFFAWRDMRVMEECHWYGWFIDYWMEGGLMRDMFTHKITTPEHWNMLMMPTVYSLAELDYDRVVGADTVVTPSYDPHCGNGEVTDGCEPVAVISAEKLRDYAEGPAETTKIAQVLLNDQRMGQYVIAPQAWDCIWDELIVKGKGLKTINQRPGWVESDYNFSEEMLEEMIWQLNRLITKYSGPEWNTKATANRIVELLVEHRSLIQIELNEVRTGVRKLTSKDMLGPRARRRLTVAGNGTDPGVREGSMEYFDELERRASAKKTERKLQRVEERKRRRREGARAEAEERKAVRRAAAKAETYSRRLERLAKAREETDEAREARRTRAKAEAAARRLERTKAADARRDSKKSNPGPNGKAGAG